MLTQIELNKIDRKTWSGHNHTEFCPHGSGENTELYIQKAIAAGFKTYSITEHFPLPPAFYKAVDPDGSRHAIYTAAMSLQELPNYFRKMQFLKQKYQQQIRILVGFEFDYFAQFRDWTAEQLRCYQQQIDDGILSVHFLPTKAGLRAVDESAVDFKTGVLNEFGSPLNVAKAYLSTIKQAIDWDIPYKPNRYGHLMLYRKWRNSFSSQTIWHDRTTVLQMQEILEEILKTGGFLDCNCAGLFRLTQTELSPTSDWLFKAQVKGIPLVFGADAHQVASVAQGYNTYLESKYYFGKKAKLTYATKTKLK